MSNIVGEGGVSGDWGQAAGEAGTAGGAGQSVSTSSAADFAWDGVTNPFNNSISGGNGGNGGLGAEGLAGGGSSYSTQTYLTNFTIYYSEYDATPGGNGGAGGAAGAGGNANASLSGADGLGNIAMLAAGGRAGFTGGGGNGGNTSNSQTYITYADYSTSTSKAVGSSGGNGGANGGQAKGGDSTVTVTGGSIGENGGQVYLAAQGGGGSSANYEYNYRTNGSGGSGVSPGAGRTGSAGGKGGDASVTFSDMTLHQPLYSGTAYISLDAGGAQGGNGGAGGAPGYGSTFSYVDDHGVITSSQTDHVGTPGAGGVGGAGGSATVTANGNHITIGESGTAQIVMQASGASGGAGGSDGTYTQLAATGAGGTAAVNFSGNDVTAGSVYLQATSDAYQYDAIANAYLTRGTDVTIGGNSFTHAGADIGGLFQFYVGAGQADIILDVNAHQLIVNGQVNTISGFAGYTIGAYNFDANGLTESAVPITIRSGTVLANQHLPAEFTESSGTGDYADTLNGQLSFTDANLTELHHVGAVKLLGAATDGGSAIPKDSMAALASALTTTVVSDTSDGTQGTGRDGTLGYSLAVPEKYLDFLKEGENLTLTYSVDLVDGSGGIQTQPVSFIVHGVNDAPITQDDHLSTTTGALLTIDPATLLTNDHDPEGDSFTITAVSGAYVYNGQSYYGVGSANLADGVITYQADPNFTGQVFFYYTVTDAHGASSNGTAYVDIARPSYTLAPGVLTADYSGTGHSVEVHGNAQDNALTGSSYEDALYGGAGNDTLDGNAGADYMEGGDGNDIYYVDNPGDVIKESWNGGKGGIDSVYSSISIVLPKDVENVTLTGSDNINATGTQISHGVLTGNSGNNILTGGALWDTMYGGDGNDTLYGRGGADALYGGAGNDLLDGGTGADYMEGGTGNDVYYVDNPGDVVREYWENGNGGFDTVYSTISYVAPANVEAVKLIGTDNINATARYNEYSLLAGNDGNNTLTGGDFGDTLYGRGGDDILIGGAGGDTLYGGAGHDQFRFTTLSNGAKGDSIADFEHGTDTLAFARSAFSGLAGQPAGTLASAQLGFGTAATTATQHLIYDATTGNLYYDDDANGAHAQVQIATLSGHPTLTAGDIMLM